MGGKEIGWREAGYWGLAGERRCRANPELPTWIQHVRRAASNWGSSSCAKIQVRADSMKRDEVISKLRAHEAELKAAGIVRLAVFGSVARGDNSPESDVDLLADFDETKRYTLLTMGRIESRLADLLGTGVDLSSPEWLKEPVKNQILREAIVAF